MFAPTNAAFAAISSTLETLDQATVTDILLFHTVQGVRVPSAGLFCNSFLTMANGERSQTLCNDQSIASFQIGEENTVNPAIIDRDVAACNGVIHVLDGVMLPGGIFPSAMPSGMPSLVPSSGPTAAPDDGGAIDTPSPTTSSEPSSTPSLQPSSSPSQIPSDEPTVEDDDELDDDDDGQDDASTLGGQAKGEPCTDNSDCVDSVCGRQVNSADSPFICCMSGGKSTACIGDDCLDDVCLEQAMQGFRLSNRMGP